MTKKINKNNTFIIKPHFASIAYIRSVHKGTLTLIILLGIGKKIIETTVQDRKQVGVAT